ncbi:SulP family inorganic anion transporter [Aquimarina sp. D1M17]|uniref:SulP family inorganic anion transporter n=1 Tax=Aquimarina acroporae TaxID=2937283 RepID=UPI0020C0F646|nr:SulP family inorganic anion transporter [Aquimarina acroporae]MCK8523236.1 SulP family inorganic anion transporter [Aquimarina acroporae]
MKGFFNNLKGDAFGGLTAGIVALPLALAFGVSSGLGPSAGLYGAIFISFFAALFGGTNTQISGPTAPMTAVSMLIIAGLIGTYNGDVNAALPAILTVFLLSGIIQIGLGAMGVGKYIRYIPYPVVSGFMTAIGVMILVTQILPALGYYPKEDESFVSHFIPEAQEVILNKILKEEAGEEILVLEDFKETIKRAEGITEDDVKLEAIALAGNNSSGVVGALKSLPNALSNINYLELILCLATILVIYGFKRITTAIPSTLVALLVVSGVAYGFDLNYRPIQEIPSGFPKFNFSIFSNFSLDSVAPYIFSALTLSILGAIDSLLTSVVADNMTKTKHNPNKELVGQGIGNTIGALFGGIPGAGATIRTVVNINAGGKTRLSGMIAGVLLLIVLLALGPVASQIPAAVLAGILITVGIGVMDYKGLRAIPHMPKIEVVIMLIVLVLSVTWNLIYAVGIGLIIASLIFMKKMGDVTARQSKVESLEGMGKSPKFEKLWKDEVNFPKELKEEIFIKHLSGPVFFGSTSELQELADQIPETATHVIIRMDKVPYMDQSGVYVLEEMVLGLEKRGIKSSIVGMQKQPLYLSKKVNIIPDLVANEYVFPDFDSCINALIKIVNEKKSA